MLVMLILAPAAMAQRAPEPPCTKPFEKYLADVNGLRVN